MANQELASKVLDQILAHPEQHNQGSWAKETECGTTRCVAGWACELAGVEVNWTSRGYDRMQAWFTKDELKYIPEKAAQLFGISDEDAQYLFFVGADAAVRNLKHFADTGEVPHVLGFDD